MRVIFMGTPDYAGAILKTLIDDETIEVVGVYTQPDKPVGRKKIMTPPVVKTLACESGIKVYQPNRLRDEDVIEKLLKIECDYIVVAAYGQILPSEILQHAPCINLHTSILPRYRGASPIQQAILNGDKTTGVTAMLMDEGLDTGDIIKIVQCSIDDDEMVEELFEKLTNIASDLTVDVLKNFLKYTPISQNDEKATHCKKITKADGLVEFDDAKKVYNKYRAFTPWPGVYLKSGLKLKKIKKFQENGHYSSGKILKIEEKFIVVGANNGTLKILRVQPPSKKEMDIISYINGQRLSIEDYIS